MLSATVAVVSRLNSRACGVRDGFDVVEVSVASEDEDNEDGDATLRSKSRRPSSERTSALSHCCTEIEKKKKRQLRAESSRTKRHLGSMNWARDKSH